MSEAARPFFRSVERRALALATLASLALIALTSCGRVPQLLGSLEPEPLPAGQHPVYGYPPEFYLKPAGLVAQDVPLFLVDSRTGQVFSWRRGKVRLVTHPSFSRGSLVQLVIVNINPFLYRYAVAIDSSIAEEPSILPFLKAALGLGITLPKTVTPAAVSEAAKAAARDTSIRPSLVMPAPIILPPPTPDCTQLDPTADVDFRKVQLADSSATRAARADSSADVRLSEDREQLAASVEILESQTATSQEVHDAAGTLTRGVEAHPGLREDLGLAGADYKAFKGALTRFRQALQTSSGAHRSCSGFEGFGVDLDQFVVDDSIFGAIQGQADSLLKGLDALRNKVLGVDQFDAYYLVRSIGGFDKPTDVTIRITRKTLPSFEERPLSDAGMPPAHDSINAKPPSSSGTTGSKEPCTVLNVNITPAPSASAKTVKSGASPKDTTKTPSAQDSSSRLVYVDRVHFGGRTHLVFGAGLFWAGLPSNAFGVSDQFTPAPAGAPGDTVSRTIVVTQQSNSRALPALTFSARFTPDAWIGDWFGGLYLVTGVGFQPGQSVTDWQFLAGMGLSFFGERVMPTVAVLAANLNELSAPYSVGQHVPTTVGSTITKKVLVGRLALGLSIKVE